MTQQLETRPALPSRGAGSSGGHAVVIGGSMAGLLAARVLAHHFDRVTIVERDRLPEGPEFRKGVPQSRHVHVLLGRGQHLLEWMFPGLVAELTAAGALSLEWPGDVLWLTPAGWHERYRPSLPFLSCSRVLLEWSVRHRLAASRKVRFLEECDVTGLLASADRTAVVGVQLRGRDGTAGTGADSQDLRADLVVDASGRDSRTPRWLEALGYAPPDETKINSLLGYASRYYERPANFQADWEILFFHAKPLTCTRGGGLFPVEGGRWLVTLAGIGRDYPPSDEAGFLEFARTLRSPILYEAIKDAQPLSPIYGYRRTENQMRHYDRLRRWPERLLALGDAVYAFNPIYGQGMTVAAQDALVLHRCLREQGRRRPAGDLTGLSRRFQKQVAAAGAAAWLMATGEDFRYPTTEGGQPDLMTRFMHRYLDRVIQTATANPTVSRAFLDVLNLLVPPATLFQPRVVAPVLRGARGSGEAAPPPAPPRDERRAG